MSCKRKCNDCCDCLSPVPAGCAACRFFTYCQQMISRKGTETSCDWIPNRYQARSAA